MSAIDVLIEIGAEEIPDRFLPEALEELRRRFEQLLTEAALPAASVVTHGTPRRLAVLITAVTARQDDRVEEILGPPVAQAFKDDKPTPAAEGFAKKVGVSVAELRRVPSDKGERLAGTKQVPGRSAQEVIVELAPRLVETLPWPKNMRWGDATRSWVRPIRWVVALAGADVLPLSILGVEAARTSLGHRTLSQEPVSIARAGDYLDDLRRAHVIVDREERKSAIRRGLAEAVAGHGWDVVPDDALVDTTCDLVEWPVIVKGEFPAKYLELPDVVLSTAMRVHQRFFALTDAGGKLVGSFLHVANQVDPKGTIAANNAQVLVARLDDASFFWSRDRAVPLESRVEGLGRVLFQDKLGTYLDKVRRMERIAVRAIPLAGLAQLHEVEDVAALVKSVELCKADLGTEMVREFGELQGVMGGIYLRLEGYGEDTCRAIEEHYLPESLTDPVPSTRLGALLSAVDKVDTLVGCFGFGIIPTGSKDPFGLRRAAQGFLRTLLEGDLRVRVSDLLEAATENFEGMAGFDAARVKGELLPYLEQRLRFLLTEGVALGDGATYFSAGEVSAVMAASWDDVPDVVARARALVSVQRAGRREDFEALSVALKRVRNIVRGQERADVDAALLREPAEQALWEKLRGVSTIAAPLAAGREHVRTFELLATLRPEVDTFFEKVLVMAEDPALRRNRLALLQAIETLFLTVADVGEIAPART